MRVYVCSAVQWVKGVVINSVYAAIHPIPRSDLSTFPRVNNACCNRTPKHSADSQVLTSKCCVLCRSTTLQDWGSAYSLIKEIRAHKAAKKSTKPYAVLVYRGVVVGPYAMWNMPEYAGYWLTDDNGTTHNGTWDFRNRSAREFYVNDLLRTNNASNCDGAFIDTGDAVATSGVLTVQSRREIFNATAQMWGELVVAGNAGAAPGTSFFVTPSLKDHLGTVRARPLHFFFHLF